MDWDKLRIFHAVADAGSLTHAGDTLHLSQSAVSRQIRALEESLNTTLFRRHARGLLLTEQGEMLFEATRSMTKRLDATAARIRDSEEEVFGELRVTTTTGFGTLWLAPRLPRLFERYPNLRIDLMLEERVLDLAMREADVAIRLRQPTQPDLIQRKLFSLHFHACASPEYLKRFGTPRSVDELDKHRLIILGGTVPPWLQQTGNWLLTQGHDGGDPRRAWLTINNVLGVLRACQRGIGIAMLPDYLVEESSGLVQLFGESSSSLAYDCYFVYPEELKSVARVQVFRDFLVSKAQRWHF
jgi:DNA-binding transcriptional LysR family regulator